MFILFYGIGGSRLYWKHSWKYDFALKGKTERSRWICPLSLLIYGHWCPGHTSVYVVYTWEANIIKILMEESGWHYSVQPLWYPAIWKQRNGSLEEIKSQLHSRFLSTFKGLLWKWLVINLSAFPICSLSLLVITCCLSMQIS